MKSLYMVSGSSAETQSLGERIGRKLDSKFLIGLSGELGSGKTSFVQGLARGLDVPESYYITSPTYLIIHEYPGRIPLFHIDLYRIRSMSEIEEMGLYEIIDRFGIFAIEWPGFVIKDSDEDFLLIHFEIVDDDKRKIEITARGERSAELMKELKK
ncbi:MAG: tRNA (adenosine(37)-N6)-threonylcarbamoyltransferase complex ATPase subunit type 1 TsaE [Desulfobacterales bacterium]